MAEPPDEADDLFSLRNTILSHLKDEDKNNLSRLLQELFSDYMKFQNGNNNDRKN